MMQNVYMLLGGILSAIALSAAGMFIFARAHYLVKVLMATLVVVLSIYAWSVSVAAFGYAVDQSPHDKDRILALSIDKAGGSIYFWIAEKDGPRAFRIPYSDKTGKALAEAEAEAKQNGGVMLFRTGKQKQQQGGEGQGGHGNGNSTEGGKGGGQGGDKNKGGKGGAANSYGATPMGGDTESVDVTIDVVPSLPEKKD